MCSASHGPVLHWRVVLPSHPKLSTPRWALWSQSSWYMCMILYNTALPRQRFQLNKLGLFSCTADTSLFQFSVWTMSDIRGVCLLQRWSISICTVIVTDHELLSLDSAPGEAVTSCSLLFFETRQKIIPLLPSLNICTFYILLCYVPNTTSSWRLKGNLVLPEILLLCLVSVFFQGISCQVLTAIVFSTGEIYQCFLSLSRPFYRGIHHDVASYTLPCYFLQRFCQQHHLLEFPNKSSNEHCSASHSRLFLHWDVFPLSKRLQIVSTIPPSYTLTKE